jgi:hypothetical protein
VERKFNFLFGVHGTWFGASCGRTTCPHGYKYAIRDYKAWEVGAKTSKNNSYYSKKLRCILGHYKIILWRAHCCWIIFLRSWWRRQVRLGWHLQGFETPFQHIHNSTHRWPIWRISLYAPQTHYYLLPCTSVVLFIHKALKS